MVRLNHQNKGAQSGTWHTMDHAPGDVYVSLDMLYKANLLCTEHKDYLEALVTAKGWVPQ